MDGAERGLVPAEGTAAGIGDVGALLNHAELLLSFAEAAAAKASDRHEATWREAIDRLIQGVAVLRTQAAAGAVSLLEEAHRERASVAATTEVLRAEAAVLRAEIDVLHGERDLSLTLAMEAGGAVSRHLAQWRQLQGAARHLTAPGDSVAGSAALAGDLTGGTGLAAAMPDGPATLVAESIPHLAALAGAHLAPAAMSPVSHLTLTIAALPGLVPLFELERALARIPGVRTCSVTALRRDLATVDLALDPPKAPLIVAADILGLPACPLLLDDIADQRIATRFARDLPLSSPDVHPLSSP